MKLFIIIYLSTILSNITIGTLTFIDYYISAMFLAKTSILTRIFLINGIKNYNNIFKYKILKVLTSKQGLFKSQRCPQYPFSH